MTEKYFFKLNNSFFLSYILLSGNPTNEIQRNSLCDTEGSPISPPDQTMILMLLTFGFCLDRKEFQDSRRDHLYCMLCRIAVFPDFPTLHLHH